MRVRNVQLPSWVWDRSLVIRGSDEVDLSSLEGLAAEDLTALQDFVKAGLTADQITELSEQEDEEDETAGLKSALRKERVARKDFERKFKALEKQQADLQLAADKTKADDKDADVKQTKQQAETATAKSERLAAKLSDNAVETTVIKVLQGHKAIAKAGIKFADLDDVLRLLNREDIDVDQDDDDPSKVSVDEDSVVDALRALAKKKPHLLAKTSDGDEGQGSGSGATKSGGKFGGGKGGSAADRQAELRRKYPALNNSR